LIFSERAVVRARAYEPAPGVTRRPRACSAQWAAASSAEDVGAVELGDDELAALDPAAADLDALASTAREQMTRRHEAEEAAARREADEQARRDAGKVGPVVTEPQPLPPRLEPSATSVDFGPLTHHHPSPELS
jgi:hypothetical protein